MEAIIKPFEKYNYWVGLIFGKCVFFRNVLILEKCAYFGKWSISHLRYSLYRIDSSIRIGLLFMIFEKKILT